MPERSSLAVLSVVVIVSLAGAAGLHASGLVDPTRPAHLPPASIDPDADITPGSGVGLVLTSILVSDDRRLAVINGKTVSVGDQVGGVVVLEIQPTAVQVLGEQGQQTVWLAGAPIKLPAVE